MIRIFSIILVLIAVFHGLIHLMGFIAYFPLAKVPELPYKTTLLSGRINLSPSGMRIYSLIWLIAAIGFVVSAVLLAIGKPAWPVLMLASVLLSIVISSLDWGVAFRGAILDVAILLVLGVVFGLRVQPAPFSAYTAFPDPVRTVPIPASLPKPVERFYHQTYGDQVPVYHSAVIDGRGTVRFMGITFPARMRFTYIAGQGYHHYIETTFWGIPILKVNEHYLDGHSRFVMPFGVVENDLRTDSAANQGLWAESLAFPSIFVTDPRVTWEAVDDTTARLHVPFEAGATREGEFNESEQVFTVKFDLTSGEITRMETMRYRDQTGGKLRWWGDVSQEIGEDGIPARPAEFRVNWGDESSPWLIYRLERSTFNTDVSSYIHQSGQ